MNRYYIWMLAMILFYAHAILGVWLISATYAHKVPGVRLISAVVKYYKK